LAFFQNSILWSLVAELIYHLLYPFLRILKAHFGWNKVIPVSYILAYSAILTHPAAKDYSPTGKALNWLICFPCCFLGCRLAEEDLPLEKQSFQDFSCGNGDCWCGFQLGFAMYCVSILQRVIRERSMSLQS